MKRIKVNYYSIQADGISNEMYNSVEWNIDMDVVEGIANLGKQVQKTMLGGTLGENGLLLDAINDDDFILIPDGIYITGFETRLEDRAVGIKGICRGNPEVFDDKDAMIKEFI